MPISDTLSFNSIRTMLIFTILAFLPIALSETYIGIYQINNLKHTNVSFTYLPIFRFHYQNTDAKTLNWREQTDGISVVTTCSPDTLLHLTLWNRIIRLFDNVPYNSQNYRADLLNCPPPLYLDIMTFDSQCKLGDSKSDSDNEEHVDHLEYKDILKSELTDEDKNNKTKLGFQKSCLHDYSFYPWATYSDLVATTPIHELFGDHDTMDSFTQLLVLPKIYEIRYDFKKRITNLMYQEFLHDVNILDLYWFNINYDQYTLQLTAFFKFETSNPEVLSGFKFYSQNLDLPHYAPNIGKIKQSVSGVGSHKTLRVKLDHKLENRSVKLVHFLENSVFVDPLSMSSTSDTSFKEGKCTRNEDKDYDKIRTSIVNIENTSMHSPSQRIEVTVCPPNNEIEYTLPIHLRYIPICKAPKQCNGYDYSLLTPPAVYYSTDYEEDVYLFDDYELAQLIQHTFSVSFYKYISEIHIPPIVQYFNKTYNSEEKDKPYWSRAVLDKEDNLHLKSLSINKKSKAYPSIAEFREDTGHLYNAFSITCGSKFDYLVTAFVTIVTSFLLTVYTIFLLLSEDRKYFYAVFLSLIRYSRWGFRKH